MVVRFMIMCFITTILIRVILFNLKFNNFMNLIIMSFMIIEFINLNINVKI